MAIDPTVLRLVSAEVTNRVVPTPGSQLDVASIYAQHAQFLWRNLARAGVPDRDLPDALQEVLLVVHRRLDSFDSSSRLTTWLFGICVRVASTARRSQRRRREEPMDQDRAEHRLIEERNPEALALQRDAKRQLELALDCLDPEKRAVLVMFELEGLSCAEIADIVGIPKGTVFSRLSNARRTFLHALRRLEPSVPLGGIE